MSLTASSRPAESGHWYSREGIPRYTVIGANGKERATTLRDARKENLVPSVTTILKVANNPVLNQWIQKQVLMAALTLPRLDDENDDSFVSRVMIDSKEQGRQAADLGTDIHASIQAFYEGKDDQSYIDHRKACVRELQAHFGDRIWVSERAFAHELGFGGKCDLHNPQGDGIVVDIKTKDFDNPDKVEAYDDNLLQLAAYRVGLGIPTARCANVYVSRSVAGLAVVKEWSEEDLARGWEMFSCLLRFWQLKNQHQ